LAGRQPAELVRGHEAQGARRRRIAELAGATSIGRAAQNAESPTHPPGSSGS
jgi:hypothetical protein